MRLSIVSIGNARPLLDIGQEIRAINNALDETALAIKIDFDVTTQTWQERSKFVISKGAYFRDIYTSDSKYKFVNDGTRPHPIRPVRAQSLRFQEGYAAKTAPRIIASRQGGPFGQVVYREEVFHPGIQGRFFDEEIAGKWEGQWPIQLSRSVASEF
jgi:hypothetical protein